MDQCMNRQSLVFSALFHAKSCPFCETELRGWPELKKHVHYLWKHPLKYIPLKRKAVAESVTALQVALREEGVSSSSCLARRSLRSNSIEESKHSGEIAEIIAANHAASKKFLLRIGLKIHSSLYQKLLSCRKIVSVECGL